MWSNFVWLHFHLLICISFSNFFFRLHFPLDCFPLKYYRSKGAPLGGYLADKVGRKNTVVPAAMLISLGAILTAYTGSCENATFTTLLPSILVWGLGNSMVNPGLSAFAADIADDESTRSQALSLSRMAGDAAFLICPFGLGLLAQYTDFTTALLTSALITAVANATFALRSTEKYVPAKYSK